MNHQVKTTYLNDKAKVFLRILLLMVVFLILYKVHFKFMDLNKIIIIHPLYLLIALILMPLNVFLEFQKLKTSLWLRGIKDNAFIKLAFLQGIVVSFFTPALLSSTFGRLQKGKGAENEVLMASGFVQSLAQFGVSIGFALFATLWIQSPAFWYLIPIFCLLFLAAFWLYFLRLPNSWLSRFPLVNKINFHLSTRADKGPVLMLSLLRYVVFSIQFHLVLEAFGFDIGSRQILVLMLSYGIITCSPSILFGKIVIREGIAAAVFYHFGFPIEVVITAAFCTWLFNVVVPVIWASILLFVRK